MADLPGDARILVYPGGRNARLAVADLVRRNLLGTRVFVGYADDHAPPNSNDTRPLEQAVRDSLPTHVLICARRPALEQRLLKRLGTLFPNTEVRIPRTELIDALAGDDVKDRRTRTTSDIKRASVILCKTCNIRCSFCYQTDFTEQMEPVIFNDMLAPVYRRAELLQLVGGEVTAYNRVMPFAESIPELYPNLRLGMTTNGTLFDERWAKVFCRTGGNVLVSIAAGTPESYKAVAGRNLYQNVVENLRDTVRMRNRCGAPLKVFLGMVISPQTQQDIETTIRLGASLGVDRVSMGVDTLTMDQLDRDLIEGQVRSVIADRPVPVHWDRLRMLYPDLIPDTTVTEPCTAAQDSLFVEVNGDVFVCCHSHICIGSLATDDINTIWQSQAGYAVEKDVSTGQCATCPQDCIYRPATVQPPPSFSPTAE